MGSFCITPKPWKFSALFATGFIGSLFIPSACAQQKDTFHPYLGYSYVYEDNLLRLPDTFDTQTAFGESGKSDMVQRIHVGIALEKQISQQLISANVSLAKTKFARFGRLNHDDKNVSVNWNWHLGNHLQGNIGGSYVESLTPFTDFKLPERNIRKQHRENADVTWRLHPSWQVRGGFSHYNLEYDLISQRFGNRERDETEVGVDYLVKSGSTAGLQLRHVRGEFPNPETAGIVFLTQDYKQNEVKTKINWLVTGKTTLQFLGGWVKRKHDVLPVRDYSGTNARLVGNWAATGKLNVTLGLWREIGAVEDLTTSYSLNKGGNLSSLWQFSSKTKLEASYKREARDFNQSVISLLPFASRSDVLQTMALSLAYKPINDLQFTMAVQRSTQEFDDGRLGNASNGVSLAFRYQF